MSNIINIEDLKKEFVQKTKLKDTKLFVEKQMDVISSLINENAILKEKIAHLEELLLDTQPVIKHITPEEMICIDQLSVLKSKSDSRELSLDEVKRLDLLVKNLRLIREESTQVINTTSYSEVKEADLVAIATNRSNETE